jgi:choline-sulfatase
MPGRSLPSPRRAPSLATVIALVAAASAAVAAWVRSPRRPNIVVVVIDTLRADHLPVYGYAKDTAPFLSALAAESVVFSTAQSTSAWTAPATASLFTSLYPFQHNVVTGFMVTQKIQGQGQAIELDRLPEDVATLPEVMKAAGYSTFGLTANINIGDLMGFARGFERFRNYTQDEPAEVLAKRAKLWRPRMEAAAPYFLYLHFMDPHAPYREWAPWYERPPDPARRREVAYDSEIAYLDSILADLYSAMRWDRDTILIVTADHGEEFGDHDGRGHGKTLYAEMLNVPLIVRDPQRFPGPRRVTEPVALIDILPTLRELAGLPPEPRDEGLSLLPLLAGAPPDPGRRSLFAHLLRRDEGGRLLHSARRGQWKYIEGTSGDRMLFDLSRDARESTNLVDRSATVAAHLQSGLREFVRTSRKLSGKPVTTVPDAQTIEHLRALGYVQ